jgi:hypothetical protein
MDVIYAHWVNSKKNNFDRVQQSFFTRHKDVERCPVAALGLYFLYRFHNDERVEAWPDLNEACN